MKKIACLLGSVLAVTTQCALGQALKRMPFPRVQPVEPQPDKDGVYSDGPRSHKAELLNGALAVNPNDPSLAAYHG